MGNQYYNELIHSIKPGKHTYTEYVNGEEAGLHPRGNVLLGAGRFMTSLKPRFLHYQFYDTPIILGMF